MLVVALFGMALVIGPAGMKLLFGGALVRRSSPSLARETMLTP